MSVFGNWVGVMGHLWKLGGNNTVTLNDNSPSTPAFNIKDGSNANYINVNAKELTTSDTGALTDSYNKLITHHDLQARVADIQFSFAGVSPPTAGTNSNKFGLCHTTGGSSPAYTAGQLIYDNGSSLLIIPSGAIRTITTRTAGVGGSLGFKADWVYAYEGSSWVAKCNPTTSGVQAIIVPFTYSSGATITSSTNIPTGAYVLQTVMVINTAFNGSGPTAGVTINGTTPITLMSATVTVDNDLTVANQYDNLTYWAVASANAGPIQIQYTSGTSSTGSGYVLVQYIIPNT